MIQQGRVSVGDVIRTVARELQASGLAAPNKLPRAHKYNVECMMSKEDHSQILLRFVTQDDILCECKIDLKKVASNEGRSYLQKMMRDTLQTLGDYRAKLDRKIITINPIASGVKSALH